MVVGGGVGVGEVGGVGCAGWRVERGGYVEGVDGLEGEGTCNGVA